jgi:hypothetical protein
MFEIKKNLLMKRSFHDLEVERYEKRLTGKISQHSSHLGLVFLFI